MTTRCEDVAALRFDAFKKSYLRIVGRLEDMQNEFGKLISLVDLEEFVDVEMEGDDDLDKLFEAVGPGRESYKMLKADIYEHLIDADEIDPDVLAFMSAAVPEPLRPIIINVPPSTGGSGVGYIGGLLFTVWLIANMS